MIEIYNNFLSLLKMIEIDFNNIEIKLVKINRDKDKWFLYNQYDNTQDIGEIKKITLDKVQLDEIYPFTLGNNQELNLDTFIEALDDRSLAILLQEYISLEKVKPIDNDIEAIVSNINSLEDILSLSYEYIEYEEYIFDIFSQVGYEFSSLLHETVINKEIERILAEMKILKLQTIGCAKSISILKDIAIRDFNIDSSQEGLYLVDAGGLEYCREGSSERNYQIASALWFTLLETDGIYQTKIRSLPIWAIELLRFVLPRALKSSNYQLSALDTTIFKTAEELNADGGLYQEFDMAYQAAKYLLK
jgi:hypothetical protein